MYQPITDFRGGLDTRKMSLTLPAGTLIQCQNAHINQGAEIEKRKAFAPTAIGVSDSFGLQAVPSGIMIFGSTNHAGVSFPAPLIYQQLQHPQTLAGGANVNMTAVLHSCLFGNFAFVIAQFADGYIGCYYNGQLVGDFSAGVVLAYLAGNNAAIASEISGLVNNSNTYTAEVSGTLLEIFSNPGNSYNATVIVSSESNVTVATDNSLNYPTGTVSNTTGNNSPNASTVTIGGKVYRFMNTMAAAFDIQIGLTYVATLKNLYLAIGATGTAGTNYFSGTTANSVVIASLFVSTPNPSFTLTERALNNPGVTQNIIPGVTLIEEGITIASATGAQAQGQFKIVAGGSSTSASGTITAAHGGTAPANNSTFVITNGSSVTTYRFVTSLSLAYDVQIGANVGVTLQNLVYAITATGTPGVNYFSVPFANPDVTATAAQIGANEVLVITAIGTGTAGNSITLTHTGTLNFTAPANLSGGVTVQLSAVTVGPVAAWAVIPTISPIVYTDILLHGLTVGGLTYNLVNSLSTEGDVLIGITKADTLQNLLEAINLSGINTVNYQVTNLNSQVYALATLVNGEILLVARTPGAIGNSIFAQWSPGGAGTIFSGGSDAVALLAAPAAWFPGTSLTGFTNQVVNVINQNTPSSGFYAKNVNQTIFLYTVGNDSYANNAVVSVSSIAATVGGGVATGFCGFSFSLNPNTGNAISLASVTQIQINGFNVMNGTAVTLGTGTISTLVSAVAANINGNTATGPTGAQINQIWLAVANGNILYLSNVTTTSNDPPQTVSIASDSTGVLLVAVVGNAGLTASVPLRNINFIRQNNVTAETSPLVATCLASGGYPPYTYFWQWLSGDTAFSVSDSAKQNVTFSRQDTAGSASTEWVCVVTDSLGNTATSDAITIYQP